LEGFHGLDSLTLALCETPEGQPGEFASSTVGMEELSGLVGVKNNKTSST